MLSLVDSDAIVHEFVDGVLAKFPPGFTIPEVTSLLERSGGLSRPLHAFLLQETQVRLSWFDPLPSLFPPHSPIPPAVPMPSLPLHLSHVLRS